LDVIINFETYHEKNNFCDFVISDSV